MKAGLENAKRRFRSVAARRRKKPSCLELQEAKDKLRSSALGLDQIGDELYRWTDASELSAWVKKDPWQASFYASAIGFFAGSLGEGEVLLLYMLARLLGLPANR